MRFSSSVYLRRSSSPSTADRFFCRIKGLDDASAAASLAAIASGMSGSLNPSVQGPRANRRPRFRISVGSNGRQGLGGSPIQSCVRRKFIRLRKKVSMVQRPATKLTRPPLSLDLDQPVMPRPGGTDISTSPSLHEARASEFVRSLPLQARNRNCEAIRHIRLSASIWHSSRFSARSAVLAVSPAIEQIDVGN